MYQDIDRPRDSGSQSILRRTDLDSTLHQASFNEKKAEDSQTKITSNETKPAEPVEQPKQGLISRLTSPVREWFEDHSMGRIALGVTGAAVGGFLVMSGLVVPGGFMVAIGAAIVLWKL